MIDKHENSWNIKLVDCQPDELETTLKLNYDEFKLADITDLTKKDLNKTYEINSYNDFRLYVKACARHYYKGKLLLNGGRKVNMNDLDVYNIFKHYKLVYMLVEDVKVEDTKNISGKQSQIYYMMKDYDDYVGMYKEADLGDLVNAISQELNIGNINNLLTNVLRRFSLNVASNDDFDQLNLAPKYINLTANGVLNSKTFEFSTNPTKFGDYCFVSKLNCRILSPELVDKYYYEIANRIFNDWTEKDKDKLKYLKQMNIAAIDGNGRNVYNILIGSGGNGKSAYINILKKLSSGYFTSFNMQDIKTDAKLNQINHTLKLIAGDELPTSVGISKDMISRLKMLTTGDAILSDVKFKEPIYVYCKGLKVQATNTTPKIFENSEATARRFKLYQWTNTNFSKLNNDFDLDEIIEKTEFIEAVIAMTFVNTNPFNKFVYIKEMEEQSKSMLSGADQVYQFLMWELEQEYLVGKFTMNIFYNKYLYWNKTENGNINPLKIREFITRLKPLLDEFGLTLGSTDDRIRLSSLSLLDVNVNILNEYFFENTLPDNKYNMSIYVECADQITKSDLAKFKERMNNFEEFYSYKDLMMLEYFISKMDDDAMVYKEYLKTLNENK